MLQPKPLDAALPIFQQIQIEQAPVVLANIFTVTPEDSPALLAAWSADANWMKQQPGYISTQLHRGIATPLRAPDGTEPVRWSVRSR
jgi:hypothetical protein